MGNGPLYIQEPTTGNNIWECNTIALGGPNTTQYGPLIVNDEIQTTGDINGGGNIIATGVVTGTNIKATSGFMVAEGGTAPQMGVITLTGLTNVTISTTAVQANSRIFLSIQAPSLTVGQPRVTGRTVGTSFTVGSIALDTSTVAWLLINPA